jgi:hypothetical protein
MPLFSKTMTALNRALMQCYLSSKIVQMVGGLRFGGFQTGRLFATTIDETDYFIWINREDIDETV